MNQILKKFEPNIFTKRVMPNRTLNIPSYSLWSGE